MYVVYINLGNRKLVHIYIRKDALYNVDTFADTSPRGKYTDAISDPGFHSTR